MGKELVLTTGPLGGLGDLSLYTTLPERFTKLGYEVYLDQDNVARNDDIYNLLWSHNPYILGTSDKKPKIGYTNQGRFYDVANRFPIGSIEAMERAHDLSPPYSLAPKIYYEPQKYTIDLSQHVLVDMSAVSSILGGQGVQDLLGKMGERFLGSPFAWVIFPDGIAKQPGQYEAGEMGSVIQMNSIFEYVDAMASCRAIVCSEAGSQALAAAVRGEHDVYDLEARPEIISIISTKTFNSRGYTFRGVDYRVTVHSTNSNADYWSPQEVPQARYELTCRQSVEQYRAQYRAAKAARDAARHLV